MKAFAITISAAILTIMAIGLVSGYKQSKVVESTIDAAVARIQQVPDLSNKDAVLAACSKGLVVCKWPPVRDTFRADGFESNTYYILVDYYKGSTEMSLPEASASIAIRLKPTAELVGINYSR